MPNSSIPTVAAVDDRGHPARNGRCCAGPCGEPAGGTCDGPPPRDAGTLVPLPVRTAVAATAPTRPRAARVLAFPARRALQGRAGEVGMSTAEYAVGMLAACGFAGLLLKVLTSSTVSGLLAGLVERALGVVG